MVSVVGATTNLINTAASLGSSFGSIASSLGLPAPNILSKFASYNYVIGLHALTITDLNFPDASYKSGKVLPIICKSAGAEPDNRIQTSYGKQDFFINNLTFESAVGMQSAKTTNVSVVQFDVYEPYSIGLFMLALQQAATNALGLGANWRDAPFLLTIEFRGNTETGSIVKVPFSTRHIPIRFTTIKINSSEQGTRYLINAYATQGQALTTEFASLRTDTVIKGKTVQEVLQTGEQSLQTVVNKKFQDYVKKGTVAVADQIVILFPKEESLTSAAAPAAANSSETKTNKAFINPQLNKSNTEIFSKIGVNASTLQQSLSSVNDIGVTDMGFSQVRRGDPPQGNKSDTWDPATRTWLRGKLIVDEKTGTFKFSQDMDIPTVINQILLASSYAATALKPGADKDGFITWWRIDTQMFYVDSKENMDKSGTLPKIAVYRVVPFKVHLSKVAGANVKMPGFDILKRNAVKRYDYIFTGNNSEVLKFDIDFSLGFANSLAASDPKNTGDVESQASAASIAAQKQIADLDGSPAGEKPPPESGALNTVVRNDGTQTASDRARGGGGSDTAVQRIGKTFHDAITNPYDMVVLDLEIVGDPYWIVNSGQGNYTAKGVDGVKDLNKDGSVNWQSSEVDVIVNFRSPIDINQTTGLYDFKGPNHQDMTKNPKAGPAIGFTGLYCINLITSNFRNGEFRQTLKGYRRNGQEYKKESRGDKALNSGTPASDKAGYATDGSGKGTF